MSEKHNAHKLAAKYYYDTECQLHDLRYFSKGACPLCQREELSRKITKTIPIDKYKKGKKLIHLKHQRSYTALK